MALIPRLAPALLLLLASIAPSVRTSPLGAGEAAAQLRLLPQPLEVRAEAGRFALRNQVTIAVPSGDEQDLFAAGLLKEEIESATAARAVVRAGSAQGDLVLARDPAMADAGEEGYRIEASASGVRVSAPQPAGLFYGVQTLRQMVGPDGIAGARIVDRPAMRWRGIHDDVSRGPVPTIESLERRIRIAAEHKVNLYALYSEHAIAFRSHPLIAPPGGSFRPEELRRLGEYARRHHVSLLIEQQAFAHLDRMLGFETYKGLAETPGLGTLSQADPASRALAESLLVEAAPLSTSPFVHVGGDEVDQIGKGRSKKLVEERGLATVYLERLASLAAMLERHGKRLMFWGDFIESHPDLAPRVPRDAVLAFWDYTRSSGFESRIAPFRKAGLDVFVCPGVSNWNRVFPNLELALPNIRSLTREGQRQGALGQLNCTWDDNGDALFGLSWYPLLYGAAAAWQSGDSDPARVRDAFDWTLFRNPGHEAAEAVERVARAHTLLKEVHPMDATLDLAWLNPARNSLDRQLLAMTEPAAAKLRRAQEEAISLVAAARRGARRNADQLDYLDFAARRMHAIGQRAQFATRMKDLYAEALRHQKDEKGPSVDRLKEILGMLVQGREQSAALRGEHERLWLAENRPYWLPNLMARYDRDLMVWSEKWDRITAHTVLLRNGTPLPTAEQIGFAP